MITSETAELTALRAENQVLKARLDEAEELLRVIRDGEVEALDRLQEAEQARTQAEQNNALPSAEIAERKRTEAALREQGQIQRKTESNLHASNELLHNIINSSPSLIFALDRQHRFILANQAYFMSVEITEDRLFGHTERDAFSWDTSERLWADNEEIMLTGQTLQHEQELQLPNGAIITVVSTKFPLRDKKGQTIGLGGVSTDITAIKQAERALKASEERLRLAMDAAQLGIFDWDIPGNQIIWSQRHSELWGFGPCEFSGHYEDFESRVHPDDLPWVNQEVSRCIATHDRFNGEFRVVWPDGSLYWVADLGEFAFDPNGQALRMVGVVRDITERKQMEQLLVEAKYETALAESRNLLTLVINTAPIRVFWKDRDLCYLGCNMAFAKDAGMAQPDDLIGKDDYQMGWAAQAELYRADDRAVMESGIAKVSYDEPQLTPNGQSIWLRTSKVPLRNKDGEVFGLLGIYEDITDHKRAEEAMQQLNENLEQRVSEEAEKNRQKDHLLIRQSRSAAMGEMIGNIAHQWRQPLNTLGLILANIKDAADYQELTPEYLDGLVCDGERLIQKMSSTIDDFRHFFRPQKQPELFSVVSAIEEALSLVSSSFAHNNIKLCRDMEDDVQVIGFANEFSQVLLNLLTNTKDAILSSQPQEGLVTIRLRSDGSNAIVVVTDNGGGIPSPVIEKIFDPYFSTREKGTGIGLYMSKMIVENSMCGTISVRNIDHGAEFTLLFPLQHQAHA